MSGGAVTRRSLLGGLAAAGVCGAGLWRAAAQEAPGDVQAIEINARALPHFQPSQPGTTRFGDLEYRGGLVLSSPSEHFGGWSGLVMDADGKRLLAISDVGSWMTASVEYDADNAAPARLSEARIGPLMALRGRPLHDKREQDAESVVLQDGSLQDGKLLIGFERLHRIGRFDIRDGLVQAPTEYLRRPPNSGMPTNQGFEAVAVIRAGAFKGSPVAFAERFTRQSGYHTGWIWVNGQPQRIQLQDIDGFDITDAVGLPDGGLLILERYFRWTAGVHMRIRRLKPGEIKPGARLAGHIMLQADSGYEIDNMEGLSVHRGARGETIVSLISDNNFRSFWQRTVFLQFALVE